MPTLAEVQKEFLASLLTVPFHRHLGIETETEPSGIRVALPPKPEIVGPNGTQSPAAMFALGDAACSIRVCEEIAPRALELELGAIFFTVSARVQRLRPAGGRLAAEAEMLNGLEATVGGAKETKKATVDLAAKIFGEDGEQAAEQRMSFYVRFMEVSRVLEMAPAVSAISRLHGL